MSHQPPTLTKTKKQPPQKWAASVDKLLLEPATLNLLRPQTRHYSTVLGLYLLSKAIGLCRVVLTTQNKPYLQVNRNILDQWQTLTTAEHYFNLLDAWITRGHASLIGEILSGLDDRFLSCTGTGYLRNDLFSGKLLKPQWLEYLPLEVGNYNLSILKMFVLAELSFTDNNMKLSSLQLTDLGVSIFNDCQKTTDVSGSHIPLGIKEELNEPQALLQAIIPLRTDVNAEQTPSKADISPSYLLRVSLWGFRCKRTLVASSQHSFDDLATAVLEAFEFDNDHLYYFEYLDSYGLTYRIVHPEMEGEYHTDENCLKHLAPEVGEHIRFIYDLGEQWEFDIHATETLCEQHKLISVIEKQGKAPEQHHACPD